MIKQLVLVVIVCAALVMADCGANVSGPNVASPGRRQIRTSATCQANVSGPNVASPGKRQSAECSGNGVCDGANCVCNAGFTGTDCEISCESTTAAPTTAAPTTAAPTTAAPTTAEPTTKTPSPSCQANVSGPNVASPARSLRQAQACSGQGTCDADSVCVCNAGYSGVDCEVAPTTAAPTTAEPTTKTPSPSCQANVSGPNVASPARLIRFLRQAQVCSGQGTCDADSVCVCNAGYSGIDCEVAPTTTAAPTTAAPTTAAPTTTAAPKEPSPTCQANVSGPNVASPARSLRQSQVCNGQGACDGNNVCVCNAGYSGRDCEVAPTTAAPTATENISGDNNARASNGVAKIASIGGVAAAIVVALL